MKKILMAIIALAPLFCHAQNVKPLTPEQQLEQAQKQLEAAQKAVEAAKANAAKAQKAAAEAKAKAEAEQKEKAKQIAAKQAAIQEQIKKAQAEAERLNAEAAKLNAEAQKANEAAAKTQTKEPATNVVITSDQTKTVVTTTPVQAQPGKTIDNTDVYGGTNGWSAAATPAPKAKVSKDKDKDEEDMSRYLAGAVTTKDGKVVFTLDLDIPGMSAGDIYQRAYDVISQITTDEHQKDDPQVLSKIAIVNKASHSIAAKMYEWIVFTNNMLVSDRTEFTYTLIANCADGHLNVSMERISYTYEPNRDTGFTLPAHKVITDENALNKKMTKLVRPYGRFRMKTIIRKDEIFDTFRSAFGQ